MESKDKQPEQALELRNRAESNALREEAQSPADLDALSREETQRTIHELRVHQIELEMQSEELRRTQVELEASRARYFDLYDLAPVGYYTLSEKGLILEANLAAAGLLNVGRSALLNQPLTRFIVKEDQDTYYRHRKQISETGTPQVCELRMLRGNDAPFWVRVESTAAQETDGSPVCRTVMSNITESKRALECLKESEERYRTLAEAAHDMIFIIDRDDRVEYVNRYAAQSIGRRPEEIVGMPRASLFPAEAAGSQQQSLRRVFEQGKPHYTESTIPSADRSIQLGTWLVPMQDPNGCVTAVLGVSRDITKNKLLEEHLHQAQKMEAVGQLAGGVAHDFNNQLVGIMGFASLLAQRLDDEQLRVYAQHIVSAARRSSDLTRQLLAFARKGKNLSTNVDLHTVIADVTALLERSIDKRIVVKQQLDAHRHTVIGDPTQLHNAILNLALNARDAMPNGGEVVFATSVIEVDGSFSQTTLLDTAPGTYVEISVSDTGIGMSQQVLRRMFEPFFTTKEPGKGTGMGLASVYGTVRSHHGAIAVQSTPGLGSVFKLRLPLAGTVGVECRDAAHSLGQSANGHILVVDDEEIVRTLVSEVLKSLGHRVTLCRDGHQALAFYEKSWREVDLVILDMVMPRMGGRDLFLALRRINPGVRALLSSGFSINGEAQTILDEGVLGFVQKPFTVDELGPVVSKALQQFR